MRKNILFVAFSIFAFPVINAQNLDSGVVACYPFSGNAVDATGSGNNGVVNGATLTTDRFGNINSAYLFDGVNDNIAISNFNNLISQNEISISIWAQANLHTSNCLFMLSPDNNSDRCVGCVHYSPSYIFWDFGNIFSNGRTHLSGYAYASQWDHYVFTTSQSGNIKQIYKNGVLISNESYGSSLVNKNRTLLIGAGNDQGGGNIRFHGSIDDIRIYNRALTSSEIVSLFQVTNLCDPTNSYPHYVKGNLYGDVNKDCAKQQTESNLILPVIAQPGYHWALPNDSGNYSIGINNNINYTITPTIPERFAHMISNPCPTSYSVYLDANDPEDSTGFNFGFDYNPCHQLRVDISSNRRRRCARNITSVYYTNEGIIAASNVKVHVKMPPYVVPISATLPYSWNASDSSIIFDLGVVNAGGRGFINIIDSVSCINGITGLTQCTKAWITPLNDCLIDSTTGTGWDKSSVRVEGSCVNDTVRFVVYNTGDPGNGDMQGTSFYRIYADNQLMQTVPFQLTGGDSLVVSVVSGGATIRLEADQRPGHPGNSKPRETVEACGTSGTGIFSIGLVNQAPMDDADVDIEIDCMEIRDSYDPNDKSVSPAGAESSHYVLPNTLLDYTIRFQNTGSDTAYKVVITDTLSQYLDLRTLEPGASSHPYTMSITGEGRPVLKFTFNNINLVDSTTNELFSHGFVKFKVAPSASTPLGTQINNAADIYFDYNLPIRTNDAWITLGNYFVVGVNDLKTESSKLAVYPNPTTGTIIINSAKESIIEKIVLYSIDGKKVYEKIEFSKTNSTTVDIRNFSQGIYFLECITNKGSEKVKVIKY